MSPMDWNMFDDDCLLMIFSAEQGGAHPFHWEASLPRYERSASVAPAMSKYCKRGKLVSDLSRK